MCSCGNISNVQADYVWCIIPVMKTFLTSLFLRNLSCILFEQAAFFHILRLLWDKLRFIDCSLYWFIQSGKGVIKIRLAKLKKQGF